MRLLDALPKNAEGYIVFSPGGRVNGQLTDGLVDPFWFETNFSSLASATVPLSDVDFFALRNIDEYWAQNADRWRAEGLI